MYNTKSVGGNRFFSTYVGMRTALLSEMPAHRVCWRELKMQKNNLFWRRAGLVVALASLPLLAWVGGTTVVENSPPVISSDDIVIRLAVARAGDILRFSDGRLCQVAEDQDPRTTEIHYVCAGEPQTILTTGIDDLVARIIDVSPPKSQEKALVGRAYWENASPKGSTLRFFQ